MADITEYLEQIENAVYGKDVRQAIHDGIEQCYEDGKAGAIDLEARQAIEETNTELSQEIAVERARIDNIASLEEGSTTGDAELMDIRVGADGTTYTSAGNAVRTQIGELKSGLSDFESHETYEAPVQVPYTFELNGGGIDNEGNIVNPTSNKYAHSDPVDTSSFVSVIAKKKDAGSMYFCYYNDDGNGNLVFDHRTVKTATNEDVDYTTDFKSFPYVALSFYYGSGTSSYDEFNAWYSATINGTVNAYKIDRAEANIAELDERVGDLEELTNDSYFPSTWSSGLNALQKNIGKSLVFAVQTDTHYNADSHNYTYCTPLKNLTKVLGLDFICNLGDIIRGYKADTLTESQTDLSEIIRRYTQGVECPVLVTTGNHDDGVLYTALGTGNNSLNEIMLPNELFEKMYRPTYNTMKRVTVADALNYYFVDFDRYRVIMLNTRDLQYEAVSPSDVGINHHRISTVQAAWFESVALDTNKPIIVMCHVPLIDSLLPDANSVENADLILDALLSFKEGGGIVLCCCYGHTHVQNSATVDDILHIVFKNGGNFAEVVAIDVDNMSIATYIVGTQSASPRTFTIPN